MAGHRESELETPQRSKNWQTIWTRKFEQANVPLHKLDGFDLLTNEEWVTLVQRFKNIIGPVDEMDIMEVGCGAGAFLSHFREARSIAGIDYTNGAIEAIRSQLQGSFLVADANKIPFEDKSFDVVFSFGVFFYFDDFRYAENVLDEMLRITRTSGSIYIFDINDAGNKTIYDEIRSRENRDKQKLCDIETNHLFYPKSFFERYAKNRNLIVDIVDETTLGLAFHTGVNYRFYVKLKLQPVSLK